MMTDKIHFVQFRPDGKVRVYVNKRPPVNLGPVIEVTPDIEKKMAGIPYSRWALKDGVLGSTVSPIKLSAILLRQEDELPLVSSSVITPLLFPHEEKKQISTSLLMIGSALCAMGAGYLIKLLVF